MSKAVWMTAPRTVELLEGPVRDPGPGEVTVQAHYSLVSPGSEMHVYRGDGGLPDEFIPTMEGSFGFPVKFAYQTVGEVIAAGDDAGYDIGDRVFCTHPHQQRFTLPVAFVEPIQDGIDMRRAAFGALLRVAVNCYLDAPVRVGEVVVVTGLGLVGTFCAFLARKAALKLVLVDTSEARRQRAGWIGADAVIAPHDAHEAVAQLTDGAGADLWVETSGNGKALQMAIDHTAVEGTIAIPAWYGTNEVPLRLSPEFHIRRLRLVSSWVGMVGSGMQPRWDSARLLRVAHDELRRIDIEKVITHEIPFEQAATAYELIDRRPDETLGVLLVHDEDASAVTRT